MEGLEGFEKKTYLSVIDGKIRMRSNEADKEAEIRHLTDKSGKPTGEQVYERVFKSVYGYLRDISIVSHPEYGKKLVMEFEIGDNIYVLNVTVKSRYFQSIVSQLKSVEDFTKMIKVSTYKFDGEGGNKVIGANVFVKDGEWVKLPDAYRVYDEKTQKYSEFKYGYPSWPEGKLEKEDVEAYLIILSKFLQKQVAEIREKIVLVPNKEPLEAEIDFSDPVDDEDDLPF